MASNTNDQVQIEMQLQQQPLVSQSPVSPPPEADRFKSLLDKANNLYGARTLPNDFEKQESEYWDKVINTIDAKAHTYHDFITDKSDSDGRTFLHYACLREGNNLAKSTVETLREKALRKSDDDTKVFKENYMAFIDKLDNEGKAALHLAAERKNKPLVELLIRWNANLTLPSNGGNKTAIAIIYRNLPSVFINLFDENLSVTECKTDNNDTSEKVWNVKWNFTPVTGIHDPTEDVGSGGGDPSLHCQTALLSYALWQTKFKRSVVSLHPLVRLFVHLKHKKFRNLIRGFALCYIFWSLISILFLWYHSYFSKPNPTSNATTNNSEEQSLNKTVIDTDSDNQLALEEGSLSSVLYWLLIIAYGIIFAFMIFKEAVEFYYSHNRKSYILDVENITQWVHLICIAAVGIISILKFAKKCTEVDNCATVTAYFSTIGVLSSGLLFSMQFKTEIAGIYVKILGEVTKKVLLFLLFFSPVLFTYCLTFTYLMPKSDQFSIFSFDAFPKVIAMMTGEINYDDVFHDEKNTDPVPSPFLTKIIFLIFEVTVIIVLHNLLIGLSVTDTQELKKNAAENQVATRLREIYLLENFLLLPQISWFLKNTFLKRHMIELKGEESYTVYGNPETNIYTVYRNIKVSSGDKKLMELSETFQDIILTAIRRKTKMEKNCRCSCHC